jgi:hypothetical protein
VTTRQLVQIIDLAAQMGESAEGAIAWLDRVEARVERDWAGRPAVSDTDAKAAIEAHKAAMDEHAEGWQLYEGYLAQRTRDRQAAGQEAWEEAYRREY